MRGPSEVREGIVRIAAAAVGAAVLALPCAAAAHVERTAYWPDPAPDATVKSAAGGAVPKARSLASAVKNAGTTRVVCQPGSLRRATRDIRTARTKGYRYRPTEALRKLGHRDNHISAMGRKLKALLVEEKVPGEAVMVLGASLVIYAENKKTAPRTLPLAD